jgi:hypothetical protein
MRSLLNFTITFLALATALIIGAILQDAYSDHKRSQDETFTIQEIDRQKDCILLRITDRSGDHYATMGNCRWATRDPIY